MPAKDYFQEKGKLCNKYAEDHYQVVVRLLFLPLTRSMHVKPKH